MKPLLFGLAGIARSGKDTAAQHLVTQHGFHSYAFADPLRDGLMHILNLSPCDFEGEQKEQVLPWLGRSPRYLMQTLGTEWGRDTVHPELWLLLAAQNLDLLARTHDTARGFVVSDLRFENEAEFIRQRGGVVIHIQRVSVGAVAPHRSEDGIWGAKGDWFLPNDGTIEDLKTNLNKIVDTLHTRAAVA
ncbi:deoxynucleotide monophosphate kinase [Pseudomonas mohnii]|uniref:deoxynucleotide monophosphate kinase family protein n=1 Tax=Pseudomonas mohnii TaxID=395600 RepID=UPI0018DC8FE5|nr:deoxynucleotide monophosphate kinase [Pseudomonas mohnii]MBH8610515.1 deoxynucleotide monophosphate kinase [Pseudomonas mohnii]